MLFYVCACLLQRVLPLQISVFSIQEPSLWLAGLGYHLLIGLYIFTRLFTDNNKLYLTSIDLRQQLHLASSLIGGSVWPLVVYLGNWVVHHLCMKRFCQYVFSHWWFSVAIYILEVWHPQHKPPWLLHMVNSKSNLNVSSTMMVFHMLSVRIPLHEHKLVDDKEVSLKSEGFPPAP